MRARRYQLRKDAVSIVERGHPWIFREQMSSAADIFADGDWLRLVDGANRVIGHGIYESEGAIAIRILRRGPERPDAAYFRAQLAAALTRRAPLASRTTGIRLLHGESDGIPAVVVDRFADTLVIASYSAGADALARYIARVLARPSSLALLAPRPAAPVAAPSSTPTHAPSPFTPPASSPLAIPAPTTPTPPPITRPIAPIAISPILITPLASQPRPRFAPPLAPPVTPSIGTPIAPPVTPSIGTPIAPPPNAPPPGGAPFAPGSFGPPPIAPHVTAPIAVPGAPFLAPTLAPPTIPLPTPIAPPHGVPQVPSGATSAPPVASAMQSGSGAEAPADISAETIVGPCTRILLRPARRRRGPPQPARWLRGEPVEVVAFVEDGLHFAVDLASGQKTGTYLDLRGLRHLLAATPLAGARVLNLFAYTGMLGRAAEAAGAAAIVQVDASERALAFARTHHVGDPGRHTFVTTDVFDWLPLHAPSEPYDLVIVDPPSMTSRRAQVPNVLAAYRRLYRAARELVRPGGAIVAACCTSRVERAEFHRTVRESLGGGFTLERDLPAEIDHPVGFPQADYLKIAWWRRRAT